MIKDISRVNYSWSMEKEVVNDRIKRHRLFGVRLNGWLALPLIYQGQELVPHYLESI